MIAAPTSKESQLGGRNPVVSLLINRIGNTEKQYIDPLTIIAILCEIPKPGDRRKEYNPRINGGIERRAIIYVIISNSYFHGNLSRNKRAVNANNDKYRYNLFKYIFT